jgi:ATP synthase protein I
MSEQQRPPPPFEDFDARLGKVRPPRPPAEEPEPEPPNRSFGSGLQAGVEILAGVGGGLLIGWGLDRWFGTRPLFLIAFFMLGAAAGLLNAYRFLRRLQAAQDVEDRR